jgi:trimethylamine:corrinoid methyltransferase-like protein
MASAGRTATQCVNRIMKELLADYEAPAIDAATVEELDAFVVNRKKKIKAAA